MLWISMLVFVMFEGASAQRITSQCYGAGGLPRRCMPPFVNAAFNRPVEATNTCGLRGPPGVLLADRGNRGHQVL